MYSVAELILLARAYLEAFEMAPSALGTMICGNDKLFIGLFEGRDCTAKSAERASEFFDINWPVWLEWPKGVTRRRPPRWRSASNRKLKSVASSKGKGKAMSNQQQQRRRPTTDTAPIAPSP